MNATSADARAAGAVGGRPIGVLLVNLGTPASADVADVRRFLRHFLSDPMVVQAPAWLWRPLLEAVILPLRARRAAELYRRIWTDAGSPLLVHSRRQREILAQRLGPPFLVRLGMRYGDPSIASALDELSAGGCEHILVFALFPQSSLTTSGTVSAEVARQLARRASRAAISTVPAFHSERAYVEALAARVREVDDGVDHYVASFHGLPQAYVERGDPYLEHCRATSRALQRALDVSDGRWSLVFQSRFGPQAWLRPYADEFVPALAPRCARVLVTMPGFAADCLETLEEVGLRLRDAFVAAGGRELIAVPALNEHPRWIDAMEAIVRRAALVAVEGFEPPTRGL